MKVWQSLAILVLCGFGVANAQTGMSVLYGRVSDPTTASLPLAKVMAHCKRAGQQEVFEASAVTDSAGQYSLTTVAGICDISVAATSFERFERKAVVMRSDAAENVDVKLVLCCTSYRVEVQPLHEVPLTTSPQYSQSLIVPEALSQTASSAWEYGVFVQGGNGLTEDRNSFHFMMAGVHLGRILTDNFGPGYLKGNFEYAVELMPFWQSYTPKFQRVNCYAVSTSGTTPVVGQPGVYCSGPYTVGGTYTGVSATPIILRWNLTHWHKVMPWVQGAGGVLWTNHKYPAFPTATAAVNLNNDGPNADASVWNFTPQFGVGAHYFVKPKRSIDFAANAVHISSASLGDKNPGVNASVQFSVGYTWWK